MKLIIMSSFFFQKKTYIKNIIIRVVFIAIKEIKRKITLQIRKNKKVRVRIKKILNRNIKRDQIINQNKKVIIMKFYLNIFNLLHNI